MMIVRLCLCFFLAGVVTSRAGNTAPPKVIMEQGAEHWSFQPVRKPKGDLDSLVAEKLAKEGLSRSPEASKAALIRRLYLDVLGFPPSPEEVEEFVKARNPQAYEELVDRLLSSPHYGERWARHWLDVVRFAESNGFETNTPRRNAWPYRDYVIRAFNDDLPYDEFVKEQLAGDLLGEAAATGFLVGGPWDEVKSPDIGLTSQQRMDELHDMVATTGSTFLGMTVGCARCHNHKFDPVSQVDYYAMQAVFAGVKHGEHPMPSRDDAEKKKEAETLRAEIAALNAQIEASVPMAAPGVKNHRAPVNARLNIERIEPAKAKRLRFTITATSQSEPCIDELEVFDPSSKNVALKAKPTASGTYPNSEIHKLEHINDGQTGNNRSWISSEPGKGWVELEFPETVTISKIQWGRDREEKFKDRLATGYKIEVADGGDWKVVADSTDRVPFGEKSENPLFAQLQKKEERLRALSISPMVYGGRFEQPGPTYRLHRGEALQKKEEIVAAMPVRFAPHVELAADTPEQERRMALAKWITNPTNPLTARVMANRIWQFHFGTGIVETPSDFGVNGGRPSNPELLDWLAAHFVENGWSMKRLHRTILLSATYRQSSATNPKAFERDAGSRWLWRFPPRRLEAEALRDSILTVCGNIDLRMGGPGFDLFEPNDNYVRVFSPKKSFSHADSRRMVYLTKHRMQLDDTFGAFDCPDAGQIAPRRTTSTTPLQALNLLNSPFILQQSEIFATRLKREAKTPAAQIKRAFELTLNHPPAKEELAAAVNLVNAEGLPAFCRALLNANEFAYLF